ncbi:MAG: hypothetical protein Q7S34_03240 [bacterium]|nr:hypothetical protein [bacterium]
MNDKLSKRIMGRIYAIYLLRKVFSLAVLKATVAVFAFYELYAVVSWRHVFANMPSLTDFNATYTFLSVAVTKTQIAVQLSLAILIMLAFNYALRLLKKDNRFATIAA